MNSIFIFLPLQNFGSKINFLSQIRSIYYQSFFQFFYYPTHSSPLAQILIILFLNSSPFQCFHILFIFKMIYIFIVSFFLTLNQAQTIVHGDNTYSQISQITAIFVNSVATINVTSQYIQAFNKVPLVIDGISQFDMDILHPKILLYVKTINITTSSVSFNIQLDNSTITIYTLTIRYLAALYQNVFVVEMNHYPVNCNNHILLPCIQYFDLPYPAADYYLLSYLKGFNLTNFNFAGDYLLYTVVDQFQGNNLSIQLSAGSYTNIHNFYIQYAVFPMVTAASNNVSIQQQSNHLLTNSSNTYPIFCDNFSPGYPCLSPVTFYCLTGFKFFTFEHFEFNLTAIGTTLYLVDMLDQQGQIHYALSVHGRYFCDPGQVQIWYPSYMCSDCSLTCSACLLNLCQSCDSTLHRYLLITNTVTSAGTCLCLPGFYQSNQICLPCDPSCYQCKDTATHCTNCLLGYQLHNHRCISFCIIRYMFDGKDNCIACAKGCITCQSSGQCHNYTCNTGIYFNFSCLNICPSGTFLVVQVNSCQPCILPCLICGNYSNCSLCQQKFYLNTINNYCYECFAGCLNCTSSSAIDCLSCLDFYIFNNGRCILQTQCLQNQYILNNICYNCSANCVSCSESICFMCLNQYYLINNTCYACQIISGVKLINNKCVQICGDGLRIFEQCDDGNQLNGDGCSESCMIQKNFFCEGDGLHADFCWEVNSQVKIELAKSLTNNSVRIFLNLDSYSSKNMFDVLIACNETNQNINYIYSQQNNNYFIVLSYSSHLQNIRCNLTFTNNYIKQFAINTMPKAYHYQDNILNKAESLSKIMGYLSLAGIILIMVTHFLSNSNVTVAFMQILLIYILSLFNYKYISPIVYNFILQLKYFLLLYNIDDSIFKNQCFSDNLIFLFKQRTFLINSQYIFLIFGVYFCIIMFALSTLDLINHTLTKLYKQNAKKYKLFLYNTFSMYQPILLFCFIVNVNDSRLITSIILQVLFLLLIVVEITYIIYCMCKDKANMSELRLGQKLRNYCFVITITLANQQCFSIYPLMLYSIGLILLKIKQSKKYKQTRLRKKIEKFQQIYNEIFILINCLCIYIVYHLSSDKSINSYYNQQMILGWINILNFTIFLILNIIIVIFILLNKIYRILRSINKKKSVVVPKVQNQKIQKIQAALDQMKSDVRQLQGNETRPDKLSEISFDKNTDYDFELVSNNKIIFEI